jgi:hypothetical protein
LKLTTSTSIALDTLLHDASVQHIYIPYMQGELTGSFAQAFNKMYAHIKTAHIAMTRLCDNPKPIAINLGNDDVLEIKAEGSRSYQALSAPRVAVEGIVEGKKISIKGK